MSTATIGAVYGRWTVLRRAANRNANVFWVCRCTCGVVREVSANSLKRGTSRGCLGCAARAHLISMEGRTFGKWTVLERAGHGPNRAVLWLCECVCGTKRAVDGAALRRGSSTQCRSCANKRHKETGEQT